MSDIFISYSSEDLSRAEPLAKALEEQGWSVWWDRVIPPGKTFDQVIEEAVKAARCVIVLWSKRSIESDWVKEEANIGKQRKILVPVRIDPVDPPLGFGRIQAADLTNWEAEKSHTGFLSLLSAISEVAGPPEERDETAQVTKLPESDLEQRPETKSKESETFQIDPSHLKSDEKESPIIGPKVPRKKRFAFGIGAVALILVVSVIGWFFFSKPALYTITPTKIGDNGRISPPHPVKVPNGGSRTFTITPNPDSRIADVKVDDKSVGPKPSYKFENVTGDRTIEAIFAVNSYTIEASSGNNGSISPKGSVAVPHGGSKSFTITPKQGYGINDVMVDGKSVGAVSSYPFNDVNSDRTISASFAVKSHTIKASSGGNGSISPKAQTYDLVVTEEPHKDRGVFMIPKANIQIDGDFNDWQGVQPVLADPPNDKDPAADFPGTDLNTFYLARDNRYLYLAMTLYNGLPRRDQKTMYFFVANQRPFEVDVRGDMDAAVSYSWDNWKVWTNERDIGGRPLRKSTTHPSDYVASGSNFIEWKVPLQDIGNLNGRFVRVYIHVEGQKVSDENLPGIELRIN